MKAKADTWTIVIAGAWNPRVFSPDWVGKHLMADQPLTVEVPLASPVNHLKLMAGGVVLIAAEDRLIVGAQDTNMAAMEKAERVACKAALLLEHTPTAAVGINFGFEDDRLTPGLVDLFRLPDAKRLSEFGCSVKQTSITRGLLIEGRALNVTHAFVDEGTQILLNFHFDATSAAAAAKILDGQSKSCFDLARSFLHRVYDAKIDERDHEQSF